MMHQGHDSDRVSDALTHRIRNLEQENEVLRRHLSKVPGELDLIMASERDADRIATIARLRDRIERISQHMTAVTAD